MQMNNPCIVGEFHSERIIFFSSVLSIKKGRPTGLPFFMDLVARIIVSEGRQRSLPGHV